MTRSAPTAAPTADMFSYCSPLDPCADRTRPLLAFDAPRFGVIIDVPPGQPKLISLCCLCFLICFCTRTRCHPSLLLRHSSRGITAHISRAHEQLPRPTTADSLACLSFTAESRPNHAAPTANRYRSRFLYNCTVVTPILPRSSTPAAHRALTPPPFYSPPPSAHFCIFPALARPHLLTHSPIPPHTTAKPRHFPTRTDCAHPVLISPTARLLVSSTLH